MSAAHRIWNLPDSNVTKFTGTENIGSVIPWHTPAEMDRRAQIAIPMNYQHSTQRYYEHPGSHADSIHRSRWAYTWTEEVKYALPQNYIGKACTKTCGDKEGCMFIGMDALHRETGSPGLQAVLSHLTTIPTVHTWAYYGFFKPTIDEVLAQIPDSLFNLVPRMYFYTEPTSTDPNVVTIGRYHIGRTNIYVPSKEFVYYAQ